MLFPGDGGGSDDEDCSVRSRTSVRQMAASLATKEETRTSSTTAGGRKVLGGPGASGSLPRSPNIPPFAVQSGELDAGVNSSLSTPLAVASLNHRYKYLH